MEKLWTPTSQHERRERPQERKLEGGSIFDDELGTEEAVAHEFAMEVRELLIHLNARPDHIVYVGSGDERGKMREVFNHWRREGALTHNPTIHIDYGVPDGTIRLGDGR